MWPAPLSSCRHFTTTKRQFLHSYSPAISPEPLTTMNLTSVSMNLSNLDISYKENHITHGLLQQTSFTSLFKKFIHVVVSVLHSFLRLNTVLLYVQTTSSLPIHQLTDTWVVSTCCLFVTRAAKTLPVQVFVWLPVKDSSLNATSLPALRWVKAKQISEGREQK